jgi:AraC-like DNA-binding protein
VGALPPVAELVGFGELAQAAVAGRADVSLDEAGLALASRFVDVLAGARREGVRPGAAEQRRVVDSALWIDARSAEPIGLPDMAREAGWSPYHCLRLFGAVLGVSPSAFRAAARGQRKILQERIDGAA